MDHRCGSSARPQGTEGYPRVTWWKYRPPAWKRLKLRLGYSSGGVGTRQRQPSTVHWGGVPAFAFTAKPEVSNFETLQFCCGRPLTQPKSSRYTVTGRVGCTRWTHSTCSKQFKSRLRLALRVVNFSHSVISYVPVSKFNLHSREKSSQVRQRNSEGIGTSIIGSMEEEVGLDGDGSTHKRMSPPKDCGELINPILQGCMCSSFG